MNIKFDQIKQIEHQAWGRQDVADHDRDPGQRQKRGFCACGERELQGRIRFRTSRSACRIRLPRPFLSNRGSDASFRKGCNYGECARGAIVAVQAGGEGMGRIPRASCLPCSGRVGFMPKMAVVVEQQPFTWDVALVEAPHEVARPEEPAPAPVKPTRPEPGQASAGRGQCAPPPQPVSARCKPGWHRSRFSGRCRRSSRRPGPQMRFSRRRKSFSVQPKQLSAAGDSENRAA